MTDDPVSVVVTTYNRPDMAKRAIQSVLEQTYPAAEIIVVEDAGESDLAAWLEGLGHENAVYMRHDDNRGLAAARNTGLRLASCELIAYLDDDDRWLPTRLQAQIDKYRGVDAEARAQLAAVQVGCRTVDESGRITGIVLPVNEGVLRDSIIAFGPATPSSSFLFVRSALLEVGGFDEELISGIDHDIWMKLAVAGYSAETVREPLVEILVNDRLTMMSDTGRRITGIAQYVDKWTPTYQQWFGAKGGDVHGRRYFINVVCGLAGRNLARGQVRDGMLALRAGLARAGFNLRLLVFATARTLRTYLYHAMPGLRAAKNSIFRKHKIQT